MGSKTGTYRYINGRLEKVSEKTPNVAARIDGVYFREPYIENFGGAGRKGGILITSKGQKKGEMKKRGVREYEPSIDGDIKPEKCGTIYSYAGQHRKGRNLKKKQDIKKLLTPPR